MKREKSWQAGRQFRTEAQHHSIGHWRSVGYWRRGASFRETELDFPFSTLQTLGNLAEHILTLLVIEGHPKLISKASKNTLTRKLRRESRGEGVFAVKFQNFCNFL